jgi:hypothetical protein
MKQQTALVLVFSLFAAPAFAATQTLAGPDAARQTHRAQLIEERRARGPEAERAKTPAEESKMAKFWKNEGERSGLGNTGNRAGNFLRNLNPVPFFAEQDRRYKERQASAKK